MKKLTAVAMGIGLVLSATGYAQDASNHQRDSQATLATNGFLNQKAGISDDLFYAYWRDVHGPLAAQIDGMEQYWQHQLSTPDTTIWPAGISRRVPENVTFEGLAEVTFKNEKDRASMGSSPAAAELMIDEQNAFKGTYLHSSIAGNSITLVDRRVSNQPQGDEALFKMIVLLQQSEVASAQTFRTFVREALAASIAHDKRTIKTRIHLFEQYSDKGWDTPNVNNSLDEEQSYQAWMELAFDSREQAIEVLNSEALSSVFARQENYLKSAHVYPVSATYTMVYDGKPTLEGLRGVPVAQTIKAIGANNQTTLKVLSILHGANTERPTH